MIFNKLALRFFVAGAVVVGFLDISRMTASGESDTALTAPSSSSDDKSCAVVESIEPIATGKWLRYEHVHWRDRQGTKRVWERVSRSTTDSAAEADAVVILTILGKKNDVKDLEIAVVKQFRPNLEGYTIEMPAGLIDGKESAEDAALRELKEETGLFGKVIMTGPTVAQSTMADETYKLVVVHVDMDEPKNQKPVQHLDAGEDIEVMYLPLRGLYARLLALSEEEKDVIIFNDLYALSFGLMASDTLFEALAGKQSAQE